MPKPPTLASDWFLGAWALQGDSCRSDLGIVYRRDGTWVSQGVSGTWRIDGNRMETDVLRLDGGRKGAKPLHYSDEIETAGANEYIARRAGAPERKLLRCPSARK